MLFFIQVINQLWQAFYNKDLKQLKRKRKHELGDEPTTSEIKRQISNPIDLSGYDSIRRRSTNFPPPLPQKSSTEKINHTYGSLITGKRSSLIPLVEDDV